MKILYHLKLAYRNLKKYRLNNFLTIFSFAVAIIIVTLIGLYTYKELTTNQFYKDYNRIYKVSGWSTPTALAPFLKEYVPEIEAITRIDGGGYSQVSLPKDKNKPMGCRILNSDNSFFKVFSYPIIKGDTENPLKESKSIVISEKLSRKLFGNTDALGKQINFYDQSLTVTAVMENPPHNSSLRFDAVVARFGEAQNNLSNSELWKNWNLETFAKFHEGVNYKDVTQKIQQTLTGKGQLMYEVEHVKLYDLKQVYFNKNLYSRFVRGNEKNVKSMLWIGIIVFILAIVNFYNLSTTQAISRAHEVGVKKVNGASRFSIIKQFFIDTFLVAFISMLIAMIVVNLILPWFNDLINAEYELFHFKNSISWLLLALLGTITITTISSVYPAAFLSSFKPIVALKGGHLKSRGVAAFKKVLIVFQFTASILLIIGILFITKQIDHLKTKDLGFNKEDILCIYPKENIYKNKTAFIEKLNSHSAVLGVSMTQGFIGNWDHGFKLKTKCNGEDREIWSKKITVDTAFARVFDIKELQQQSVDKSKSYIVLNNTAIKRLESPSIQNVEILTQDEKTYTPLASVTEDFHFMPLYNGIEPLTIYVHPEIGGIFNVRFNPNSFDSIKELISFCESTFKEFEPNSPFSYQFLNDVLAQSYTKEEKYRAMVSAFSLFAIVISCLGLFGMIVFSNTRRRKEIGIRKAIGSSILEIINLLLKDYLKWIGVAFIIAVPIAYLIVKNWLDGFPFRTEISWWIFAIGGLIALFIAVITIIWQTYRAAVKKPVESLRDE